MKRSLITVAALALSALCGTIPARASTFTVTTLDDSGEGSLRQVVLDSNADSDPDTIFFDPALTGTITLKTGKMAINNSVEIVGPGTDVLTVSGGDASRIFNISAGTVILSGLTLTHGKVVGAAGSSSTATSVSGGNGQDANGGAILNAGTLTLSDVVISQSKAIGGAGGFGGPGVAGTPFGVNDRPAGKGGNGGSASGGAVYNSGTLTIQNTRLESNSATGGRGGDGGKITLTAPATPTNPKPITTFYYGNGGKGGNAYGGAIYNAGDALPTNVTLGTNTVTGGTGGTSRGTKGTAIGPNTRGVFPPLASDGTFAGVQERAFTAQLVASSEDSSLPLTYSLVSGTLPAGLTLNTTTGAITGTPTMPGDGQTVTYRVNDGLLTGNIATITFNIQAAEPKSLVVTTLSDTSTNTDNLTSLREALNYANTRTLPSTLTFDPSLVSPSSTIQLSGGSLSLGADITLRWPGTQLLTIKANGNDGGVFLVSGTAILSRLRMTGASGAAWSVLTSGSSTLNLSDCVISGNSGATLGNNGVLNLFNCTISGNSGSFPGVHNRGKATLTNCTISGNTCNFYGGSSGVVITNTDWNGYEGEVSLNNCTITNNANAGVAAIYGSVTANNCILTSDTGKIIEGTLTGTSNIVGGTAAQAGLEVGSDGQPLLKDNGGPTQTIALVEGSPAINAGSTNLATDQRGIARPQGRAADIGAFEVVASATPTPTATATSTPTPTSTPTATPTAVPTATPTPTAKPTPTATAKPTPTATAKPTPTATAKPTPTAAPLPILSVSTPAVKEGNGGVGVTPSQLVFTLSLSTASPTPVTVVVQSANASTASAMAKADYLPLGKTRITVAPGQRSQTVALRIVGDTTYEENERVGLLLSSPVGAILKSTSTEGTILNDDPVPTISINDVSVPEGNRNYSKATFTVTLSNPSERIISVGYKTYSSGRGVAIGGTASTLNGDYLASAATTLTFAPGQTSKAITVYIKGDTQVESDEPFGILLSSPVNARIGDGWGLGTILNDDSAAADAQSAPSAGNS